MMSAILSGGVPVNRGFPGLKFRKAISSDVPELRACVQQAYGRYIPRLGKLPGPMLDDYDRVVREHRVLIGENEQGIAGFLVLITSGTDILLDNVAVKPEFQGRGVGSSLIELAERTAKELGHEYIDLYTHELMKENINMYIKMGYQVTHRVTEKGYRRVYMRKVLDASTHRST